MGELAPSQGTPAPAAMPARSLGLAAALSVASATAFFSPLLFGGDLHAYDWESHHWHYFDWVRIALTEYASFPLYMADAWITGNFLANAESPSLGPLVPLLFVLPTGVYAKLLIVLFTAAGLSGTVFLLRDLDVDPVVAFFAAIVFAFGGFFVAHVAVGHPWVLGGHLLPWLVLLYRRAALGSGVALWIAAALNAAAILGGQHQPFIWQNFFLAGLALLWSIRARSLFPLRRLALLWLAAAGLSAVKLFPMLVEFADYDPQARIAGFPPRLAFEALVARGQHPGLAAPPLVYEHGAGWWEYAFYVGVLPCAALLLGLSAARRCWPLLVIGAYFLLLSLEWPAPLAWLNVWCGLEELPVWRTQRAASRFLFPALFAFLVAAAIGLERLLRASRDRWPRISLAVAGALALLVAVDLFAQSLPWQRAALGEPLASRDHRPRPLAFGRPEAARAELFEFAPNRLVYRVQAARAARLIFPLRHGKRGAEWRVEGLSPLEERGRLALELPPGEREVVLTYRPAGLCAGVATSATTLAVLVGWVRWRSRRRRP